MAIGCSERQTGINHGDEKSRIPAHHQTPACPLAVLFPCSNNCPVIRRKLKKVSILPIAGWSSGLQVDRETPSFFSPNQFPAVLSQPNFLLFRYSQANP